MQIEWSSPGFGIDLFGDLRRAQAGNTVSTATVTERTGTVGQGFWGTYPQQIGPFSDAGAPKGTSSIAATAVTQPFDPAVTSSTGDPYLNAVAPQPGLGTPALIAPGATGTVTVTVTPTGAKGTVVSGVLNLVTSPFTPVPFNATGDVIAQVPYTYTIG